MSRRPSLPIQPDEINALYAAAVMHLRRLVERDGVDLGEALRIVISERTLGLRQINELEAAAHKRYADKGE